MCVCDYVNKACFLTHFYWDVVRKSSMVIRYNAFVIHLVQDWCSMWKKQGFTVSFSQRQVFVLAFSLWVALSLGLDSRSSIFFNVEVHYVYQSAAFFINTQGDIVLLMLPPSLFALVFEDPKMLGSNKKWKQLQIW